MGEKEKIAAQLGTREREREREQKQTRKRKQLRSWRWCAEGRRSRQRVTGHERPGHGNRHGNASVSGGPRGPRSDGPELGLECCQQRLSYQRLQPLLQQDRAVREESGKGELG